MTASPAVIAHDDPEWCAGCAQKHSKCQCEVCDGADCAMCNGPSAEEKLTSLLALVAVHEAKPPAHRYIPTWLLREYIEGKR